MEPVTKSKLLPTNLVKTKTIIVDYTLLCMAKRTQDMTEIMSQNANSVLQIINNHTITGKQCFWLDNY